MTTTNKIKTRKNKIAIRKQIESKRLKPKCHVQKNVNETIGTPKWKINLGLALLILLIILNTNAEWIFKSIDLYLSNNLDISISAQTKYLTLFIWFYIITPALAIKIMIFYAKNSSAEPYK